MNLPATGFPMKADAAKREPERLARWEAEGLYQKIRQARAGKPTFLLHDGPPYANDHIHMGTALNKILKDLVVRSRSMMGFDTPFVPGWDCHGLPIEHKVDRELGAKKSGMSDLEIRAACRSYAERFVSVQREEFRRLGCLGDWEQPYLTMSPRYEADIAAALGKVVEAGLLYRERKAIRWCWSCATALAEAELEYHAKRDPEITVAFPAAQPEQVRARFGVSGEGAVSFVIWTTTPWTIPSNLAIAVHPEASYVLWHTPKGALVVAQALLERLQGELGLEGEVLGRVLGQELVGLPYRHPLPPPYRVLIPEGSAVFQVVAADYVTLDTGTGLVHIAPGHGEEDFRTGKVYGLPVLSPLDDGGRYTPEVPALAGTPVWAANPRLVQLLEEQGALLRASEGIHEYPHCWRCRQPVIFRAPEQYFIA
ncbi:MAG: class I tRNA ligase family protein, partial [Thermoanaerobaculum sp.]|nr:class I tRNA ligase family protein [Thermoanaerobaculum sp.]